MDPVRGCVLVAGASLRPGISSSRGEAGGGGVVTIGAGAVAGVAEGTLVSGIGMLDLRLWADGGWGIERGRFALVLLLARCRGVEVVAMGFVVVMCGVPVAVAVGPVPIERPEVGLEDDDFVGATAFITGADAECKNNPYQHDEECHLIAISKRNEKREYCFN